MIITPTFHVLCHHCEAWVSIPADRVALPNGQHELNGRWLDDAQDAALATAGCLDDTCSECMSIVHEARQKEADFQAERDLS